MTWHSTGTQTTGMTMCEVTIVPQLYLWGSQMLIPSLSPTEIRTDSSSNRRPHNEIRSEWSQYPLWSALVASNLAQLCWSLSEMSSVSSAFSMHGSSQELCLAAFVTIGASDENLDVQDDNADSTNVSCWMSHLVRMRAWRSSVPAAEAKLAEGASVTTLRIPRPPSLTGRLAWIHCKSEMVMFVMDERASLRRSLYVGRSGWSVQGDERKMNSIFGTPREALYI